MTGCGAEVSPSQVAPAVVPQEQKNAFEKPPVVLPPPPKVELRNEITKTELVPPSTTPPHATPVPVLPGNFGDLLTSGYCLGFVNFLSLSTLPAPERATLLGEKMEALFNARPFDDQKVLLRIVRALQMMQETTEYQETLGRAPQYATEEQLSTFLASGPFRGAMATFKIESQDAKGVFQEQGFHSILVTAAEQKGRQFNFAMSDPNLPGLPLQLVFDAEKSQFYFAGYPKAYAHIRYTFRYMVAAADYHQAMGAALAGVMATPSPNRDFAEFIGLAPRPGLRDLVLGEAGRDFGSYVESREALSFDIGPTDSPILVVPKDPIEREALFVAQIQLEKGCGNFTSYLKALRERKSATKLYSFLRARVLKWAATDPMLNLEGKWDTKTQPGFVGEWARCLQKDVLPLFKKSATAAAPKRKTTR